MDSSSFFKIVLLNGEMWFCRCGSCIFSKLQLAEVLSIYRNLAPEKNSSELPGEPQLNSNLNLTAVRSCVKSTLYNKP